MCTTTTSACSLVQRTVAGCFAILRQLRSIRRSVPSSVFQTLVVSVVLTRLDYGNSTLSASVWSSCLLPQPSTVCAQRLSAVNRWSSSVSSHYRHCCQFSLVMSCQANQVQTGSYCLPSSSQHRTSISVGHVETRRRHPIPQSSPVVDLQQPRCPPITPSYCQGTLVCFS